MTIHHAGGDLPPDVRALIEAGRDGPTATPEQRQRIDRALYRRLALGAFVTLVLSTWTTWTRAAWMKPMGLFALSAIGGILVHHQLQASDKQESNPPQFALAPADKQVGERTNPRSDSNGEQGEPASSPPEALPRRDAGAGTGSVKRPAVTASPASSKLAPQKSTNVSDSATVPVSDPLAREVELLAAARRALGQGAAAQAQGFLRQYDREVRSHLLAQERIATGVLVNCALGQVSRAKQAAADFRKRHPRSPLNARLTQSCAAHDD